MSWSSTVPVGLLPTDTHCIPQTVKMSKGRVAFALRLFPEHPGASRSSASCEGTALISFKSKTNANTSPWLSACSWSTQSQLSFKVASRNVPLLLHLNTPVFASPPKNFAWPNVQTLTIVWHLKGEDRMPSASPKSWENTTASQNSAFTGSTVLPFCNSGISSYWKTFTAPGAKAFLLLVKPCLLQHQSGICSLRIYEMIEIKKGILKD